MPERQSLTGSGQGPHRQRQRQTEVANNKIVLVRNLSAPAPNGWFKEKCNMRLKLVNQALALAVALVTSLSLAGCGIGKVSISNSCLGPSTPPPTAEFLYAPTPDPILAFPMDQATAP